ncbi:MAG: ABC transporter permease [Janthinobacterium lividum]
MLRHLITLMWNRKQANGLLILEIFLAFVVLFAVGSVGVFNYRNYRAPLGFAYADVWEIWMNPGTQPRAEQYPTLQRVLARLRSTPGVVLASRSNDNTPFAFSNNTTEFQAHKDRPQPDTYGDVYDAGPELRGVLGLQIVAGRWFDRRDEAGGRYPPIVITEKAQAALFPGGESALGQLISNNDHDQYRVVGVSGPYRTDGELSELRPGYFQYVGPQDTARALFKLLVRVQPGSGGVLEKRITDDIRAIAPGWSSGATTLAEQHLTRLKFDLALPLILAVVCVFLLVNVALGLFGVLWLNISQRRAELGVRRALGASAGAVSRQVLGEILVLTTFGLGLGLLVAAQFPLLGVLNVQTGVYLTAMGLAVVGLYALAAGCALYPSRLAAGIQPAVALREE